MSVSFIVGTPPVRCPTCGGEGYVPGLNEGEVSTSYEGFHQLRVSIAAAAGLDLEQMVGFSSNKKPNKRSWGSVDDPIKEFLNHSDCDGGWTPAQCERIAPRLRTLAERARHHVMTGSPHQLSEFDYALCLKLAKLMDLAVERGVMVQLA